MVRGGWGNATLLEQLAPLHHMSKRKKMRANTSFPLLSQNQQKLYFKGVVYYRNEPDFIMVLGQYQSWWCTTANSMFFGCPIAKNKLGVTCGHEN